jgi:hypothetical protein
MKRIALFGLLSFGVLTAFSQNAFYDAQYLVTLPSESIEKVEAAAASGEIDLSPSEKAALADYKTFLADPFKSTCTHLDINLLKSSIAKYNAAKLEASVRAFAPGAAAALALIPNILGGGFSLTAEQQTNIIDGLSKYYAEEFKKAQLITYMKVFESTIGKIGELQVLFPSTYVKLQNADPSKFPELGSEYKSIFDEDLKMLLDHLIDHIEHYTTPAAPDPEKMVLLTQKNNDLIKHHEYYGCFKITADMASKMMNNYHPSDLFNYLDDKYYTTAALAASNKTEKFELIIHGLNLIQRNLLDTARSKSSPYSNIWVNAEGLKNLNTVEEWKYFAGLIYQQDPEFFKKMLWDPASDVFDAAGAAARIKRIRETMDPIIASLRELQSLRDDLNKDNLKDNYLSYTNLVLKSLQSANYLNEDFKKYLTLASYTLNIYDNARKKDYNNSTYYTILIIKQLLGGQSSDKLFMALDQYGGFMTDVLNAKNSDEVKETIKKNVAPSTTFMLKRTYVNTLSITGQPGYFLSAEKLNNRTSFVSGITLPLGFEYTRKVKSGQETSSSIGIMVQLLDIGAILNFRVDDSTSVLPDKVEFSQVFSPGVTISYGFKNSPLTIGLGYQRTPELRTVTKDATEVYAKGDRVFLRLAWDIPLLNIVHSQKR